MPAEPERTVLASVHDVEDRERRVSLVTWPGHPELGTQVEIADYIPSQDLYGRGYLFAPEDTSKVIAGLRKVREAGNAIAAAQVTEESA